MSWREVLVLCARCLDYKYKAIESKGLHVRSRNYPSTIALCFACSSRISSCAIASSIVPKLSSAPTAIIPGKQIVVTVDQSAARTSHFFFDCLTHQVQVVVSELTPYTTHTTRTPTHTYTERKLDLHPRIHTAKRYDGGGTSVGGNNLYWEHCSRVRTPVSFLGIERWRVGCPPAALPTELRLVLENKSPCAGTWQNSVVLFRRREVKMPHHPVAGRPPQTEPPQPRASPRPPRRGVRPLQPR